MKNSSFEELKSVVAQKICKKSLKAANSGCTDTYIEYFLKGTVPEVCAMHPGTSTKRNTDNGTEQKAKDVVKNTVNNVKKEVTAEPEEELPEQMPEVSIPEETEDLPNESPENDISEENTSQENRNLITDIELNEVGIEQARQAKSKVNQYEIDMIFCSPLKRARKTAEIVNEDKKVTIVCEEKIVERCFGELEGVNAEKHKSFEENNFWDYQANVDCQNVEPVVQYCKKVWGFLDSLKENYQGKNILLVTHGGAMQTINGYFEGLDESGVLRRVGIQNCEIKEYEL